MKKSEALKILGISEGYTEEQVKQAHRNKIRENHPDRFSDPAKKAAAEEQTKLINEARDVLVHRSWEPEYGGRSSGYGPYSRPYTTYRPGGGYSSGTGRPGYGQPGGYGYGGPGGFGYGYGRPGASSDADEDDPFGNWPFETFVWTSWGDSAGGSSGWPGGRGAAGGAGANPFDPFSSIFTQTPEKSAEQEALDAKRELQVLAGLFIAKLVMLAICTILGPATLALSVLAYVIITVLTGIIYRMRKSQGCSNFLFIPILLVGGPALMYVGRIAITIWPIAVFACILAVLYDIGMLRRAISSYRTTQEKAKVSLD